jgi:hypothetical protein
MQCLSENPQWLVMQTDEKWIRNGSFVNPMNKHRKYSAGFFRVPAALYRQPVGGHHSSESIQRCRRF